MRETAEGKCLGTVEENATSCEMKEETENDVLAVSEVAAITAETLAMVHRCRREMRIGRHGETRLEIVVDSICLRLQNEI